MIVLVTGATAGFGECITRRFIQQGHKVIATGRRQERLQELKDELGDNLYIAQLDVRNRAAIEEMLASLPAEWSNIDILVNNAGIIKRIPMTEMTKQQWDQVINVDLTGPFLCAKAVLPGMIKKGYGKIINACSMMSELGRETVSAYAAAKGGLKMLTKNICSEYGQYNIQCNAIGPGYIATPQTAPLRAKQADGSMAPFDRFIRSKTPAQRWGETEDLEGLAVFLASPASDFINGQVVYIDGGILAYIGQDPSQLDESKFQDVTGVEDIKVADH